MSTAGVGWVIREMASRGLQVVAAPPNYLDWEIVVVDDNGADWTEVADTLVDSINAISDVIVWGVLGKYSGHDLLQCESCDEIQLLPKAEGAPSKNKKCKMSPHCKGRMRRMPEIFAVTKPKKKRMTKKQKQLLEEQLDMQARIVSDDTADWDYEGEAA